MTWREAQFKAINHARQYGVRVRVIADRGMHEAFGIWWYIVVDRQGQVIFG